MEARFAASEVERVLAEAEECERMEAGLQRELSYERWRGDAVKEMQQQQQLLLQGETRVVKKQEGEGIHDNSYVMMNLIIEDQGGGGGMDVVNDRDARDDCSHPIHPILGPQIARLTYKRVHLTPASTLAHDRARTMVRDKQKTLWMGIPGVISLMETTTVGCRYWTVNIVWA
jgi:hypothetical protein